jgi:hypothetical protein
VSGLSAIPTSVTTPLLACPDVPPANELDDHSYVAYLHVDDVDGFHTRAVAAGPGVLKAPIDEPWGMREIGFDHPMAIGSCSANRSDPLDGNQRSKHDAAASDVCMHGSSPDERPSTRFAPEDSYGVSAVANDSVVAIWITPAVGERRESLRNGSGCWLAAR